MSQICRDILIKHAIPDPLNDAVTTALFVCTSTPTHKPTQLDGWPWQHHYPYSKGSKHWHEISVSPTFIARIQNRMMLPCNWIELEETACFLCSLDTSYPFSTISQVSGNNAGIGSSIMSSAPSQQSFQSSGARSLADTPITTPGSGLSAMSPTERVRFQAAADSSGGESMQPSGIRRNQHAESTEQSGIQQPTGLALEPASTNTSGNEWIWDEYADMNPDLIALSNELEARERARGADRARPGLEVLFPWVQEMAGRNSTSNETHPTDTSGYVDNLTNPSQSKGLVTEENRIYNFEDDTVLGDEGTLMGNLTNFSRDRALVMEEDGLYDFEYDDVLQDYEFLTGN
ncbi:hypothetical protein BDZ45DRAFT_684369 [Acephala macrosclerotiorum]|nr:hypothetical protein BDZ45DRAFT_684369 [Acephala macrosclerotiorum]